MLLRLQSNGMIMPIIRCNSFLTKRTHWNPPISKVQNFALPVHIWSPHKGTKKKPHPIDSCTPDTQAQQRILPQVVRYRWFSDDAGRRAGGPQ